MLELLTENAGLVQGTALWTIAGLTAAICIRRSRRAAA